MQKVTEDAAAKIRAEMKEKVDKAAERQHELVKAAATELLRFEFGVEQKPAPNALQEKLKKACRCHMTFKVAIVKRSLIFTL